MGGAGRVTDGARGEEADESLLGLELLFVYGRGFVFWYY